MRRLWNAWRVLTGEIDVDGIKDELWMTHNSLRNLEAEFERAKGPLIAARSERDEFERWRKAQSDEIGEKLIAEMMTNPKKFLPDD